MKTTFNVLIQSIFILFAALSLYLPIEAEAANKAVVIPFAGDDLKAVENIIVVAEENADFSDLDSAMAATSNASETNRYLIVLAPGSYKLGVQLLMQPYVNIVGSGARQTSIVGSIGSDSFGESSALIVGADNAHLARLTVFNSARNADFASAIFNSGVSSTISDVNITLGGGLARYGIINISDADSTISNVGIQMFTSEVQVGIHNSNARSTISQANIELSGSGVIIAGVENTSNGSSSIYNTSITLSGDAAFRYGVTNSSNTSFFKLRNSTITGATVGLNASTGIGLTETYVVNTILEGAVNGSPVCMFNFTALGSALDGNCQ